MAEGDGGAHSPPCAVVDEANDSDGGSTDSQSSADTPEATTVAQSLTANLTTETFSLL